FICVVMAAPLFYAVGIIVALLVNLIRRKSAARDKTVYGIVMLPLLLAALEGVGFSWPRAQRVSVERTVAADAATVEARLAAVPPFRRPPPPFLRLKVPRPTAGRGGGLAVGARRSIHFAGGEGRPGDLLLEVGRRERRGR